MVRKSVLLLAVVLLMVGCSDDSPDTPEVVVPDPLPPTENTLVENFVIAVEAMSYDDLAFILHEDFRLSFLQSTIDEWDGSDHPLSGEYFDRTAMLDIHENLFGEVEGMDPHGQTISHVESISFAVFDKEGTWEPVEEGDVFFADYPEAYHVRYNALIHFYNPAYHRWEVDQMLDLVAVPIVDGETTGWQLLGILGLPQFSALATEQISYDGVLAMYRF